MVDQPGMSTLPNMSWLFGQTKPSSTRMQPCAVIPAMMEIPDHHRYFRAGRRDAGYGLPFSDSTIRYATFTRSSIGKLRFASITIAIRFAGTNAT